MKKNKKREKLLAFLLRLNPEMRRAILSKMKFVFLFALWGLKGSSQMNVSLSVGATKDMPLAALQVGYTFKQPYILNWGVEYDQRFFLTRESDYGAYLGGRVSGSYNLTYSQTLSVLGGYYWSEKSSDHVELNGWKAGYGLKYTNKALLLEVFHIDKRLQGSIGIYCKLN